MTRWLRTPAALTEDIFVFMTTYPYSSRGSSDLFWPPYLYMHIISFKSLKKRKERKTALKIALALEGFNFFLSFLISLITYPNQKRKTSQERKTSFQFPGSGGRHSWLELEAPGHITSTTGSLGWLVLKPSSLYPFCTVWDCCSVNGTISKVKMSLPTLTNQFPILTQSRQSLTGMPREWITLHFLLKWLQMLSSW